MSHRKTVVQTVDTHAIPLTDDERPIDPFLKRVEDARLVMLASATWGTREFHAFQARVTRRLIREQDMRLVAFEADWMAFCRINRWVQGHGDDGTARDVIESASCCPKWRWEHPEFIEFIAWLRDFNTSLPPLEQVGIHGLETPGFNRMARRTIAILEGLDAESASRAREHLAHFHHDHERRRRRGLADLSCEPLERIRGQLVRGLVDRYERDCRELQEEGFVPRDRSWLEQRHQRYEQEAADWHRAMFETDLHTWNRRECRMMERLERLLEHYMGVRAPTRAIVWGAMSHLGDGRATDPSARGETTLGQKVKERFGGAAVSIGLTTHRGTVSAASTWAGECQTCELRPARADSFAGLLHEAKPTSLVLPLDKPQIARHFDDRYLERIIGPIYTPESERQYHYVKARLASQFDVLVHWDETHALEFRPPTSSSRNPCSRRDTSASTS